ncbi:DUF2281 domain-containing protein [Pseudomonas lini]|jgi:hypothetical protein|uniref:DUF2281 domain-containing protein n=1 Tax=Pseudomonas lini TaxID=163011 RepID=A0A0J6H7P7_9PSED|nr:DUF2281 domain-containing protein [Pseudomonas lini]KAB0501076.1 DUF2281 domain-containing protein [Pseudomonas lini]KMM89705.1 hypothetical protein TU81_24370 [Pseudomonas lini]KNH44240.1 hypothetical protein ACS73_21660 [Pseudomonas lini]SDT08173.1 hypothetical protein SAMN04490191_3113 [Pseudomonas lini]
MKRDVFSELMDGLEALAEERQSRVTLKKTRVQRIGAMKGKLTLPDDLDAPLSDGLLDTFEK